MTVQALEAKAEFLLRLRARGIRDLDVLRAMEAVPRDVFVPHRYADLAVKDVALPLPCGQTMSEPYIVARMMEALAITPTCRVLEIGSGSGYATAILARLAASVLGVERFRTLALGAKARLAALGQSNAVVAWGDGMAVPASEGPFDRILVHAELADGPADVGGLLAPEGALVFAGPSPHAPDGRQWLMAARRGTEGDWRLTPIARSRLRPLYDGPSRGL